MTTKVTVKKPTGEARRYRQIGQNSNGWQGYFLAEGKKVNVGTFPTQEEAAKERDRGAYKVLGPGAQLNFPLSDEEKAELDGMSVEDFLASVKKKSVERTFSRGTSKYRGVAIAKNGKWRADIWVKGKVIGLGRFDKEEEAAAAYDAALIERDGPGALTNAAFPLGFSEQALKANFRLQAQRRQEVEVKDDEEAADDDEVEGNGLPPEGKDAQKNRKERLRRRRARTEAGVPDAHDGEKAQGQTSFSDGQDGADSLESDSRSEAETESEESDSDEDDESSSGSDDDDEPTPEEIAMDAEIWRSTIYSEHFIKLGAAAQAAGKRVPVELSRQIKEWNESQFVGRPGESTHLAAADYPGVGPFGNWPYDEELLRNAHFIQDLDTDVIRVDVSRAAFEAVIGRGVCKKNDVIEGYDVSKAKEDEGLQEPPEKEVPAEAPVRRASDPDVDRIWTDVIEKVSDGFSGEKNALQDEFARLREGALAGMAALKERVESAPVAHMKSELEADSMADYLEGLYNECTDQDTEQGAFRFGLDFLDDVMATGWDCYMHPAPGRDPKSMDFQPRVKRTDEEYEAALLALKPEGYLMQRIVEKDKKRKREARRCEREMTGQTFGLPEEPSVFSWGNAISPGVKKSRPEGEQQPAAEDPSDDPMLSRGEKNHLGEEEPGTEGEQQPAKDATGYATTFSWGYATSPENDELGTEEAQQPAAEGVGEGRVFSWGDMLSRGEKEPTIERENKSAPKGTGDDYVFSWGNLISSGADEPGTKDETGPEEDAISDGGQEESEDEDDDISDGESSEEDEQEAKRRKREWATGFYTQEDRKKGWTRAAVDLAYNVYGTKDFGLVRRQLSALLPRVEERTAEVPKPAPVPVEPAPAVEHALRPEP